MTAKPHHFNLTTERRNTIKQRFARQCFEFRQQFLVSQVRFAGLLGVSRRALQYYEAGEQLASMHIRRKFLDLQRDFAHREKKAQAA